MVNSRNKGASAERQVAKILFDELGIEFRRELRQYQQTDLGDLVCNDPNWPYVIEVKCYATGNGCKPAWWAQASKAAQAAGMVPVVIYKYSRLPWRVVMPLNEFIEDPHDQTIEMSIEAFCYVCRERMST